MKIWSRAPREPYQSKSEPFQIEVKPGVLDQKNHAKLKTDDARF